MKSQIFLVLLLVLVNTGVSYAQNEENTFRGIELQRIHNDKTKYIKENTGCIIKVKDQTRIYRGKFTIVNDSTLMFPQGEVSIKDIEIIYVKKLKWLSTLGPVVAIGGGIIYGAGASIDINERSYFSEIGYAFKVIIMVAGGLVIAIGIAATTVGILFKTSYQREHWIPTIVE